MIAGPHCYSFFDGNAVFAARGDAEMRAFYLTDFLVRQFDAFVWRPMGLDRHPELRDMIFGNYERLVYLAQTDDPALDAEAERCAARLGLAYERRFTGYGDLRALRADASRLMAPAVGHRPGDRSGSAAGPIVRAAGRQARAPADPDEDREADRLRDGERGLGAGGGERVQRRDLLRRAGRSARRPAGRG